MPATQINWNLYNYNQDVIDEVNAAIKWFDLECQHSTHVNHENLKFAVQERISRLQYVNSSKKLTFAIYALYYQGYLPDPLNIQINDIENARWVLKDKKYGIPKVPSNDKLKDAKPSHFAF